MIKQFEVGKSYYRELPSNPSFAVVEECKKMGLMVFHDSMIYQLQIV